MTAVDLAKKWYTALRARERDVARSLMVEDFVLIEAASLPFTGEINAEGLREIHGRDYFFEWSSTGGPRQFEGFDFDIHELLPVGDKDDCAVAMLTLSGKRLDGVPFSTPVAEFSWWRDGQTYKVMPYYFDTAALLAD